MARSSTPMVSVVIPARNAAQTIGTTLESLYAQTLTDWEAIIVDDGSTDETAEIVAAIAHTNQDDRLHWLGLPPQLTGSDRSALTQSAIASTGPSATRNRGLAIARGEFVAFLDADDLWAPEALADRIALLQAHPEAGLAYSWTDCIDESGRFARPGGHITCTGNVHRRLLVQNFLENGSSAIVRRSVLKAVGGFDESLRYGEDWELWLRIAEHYPFVAISKVQVLYRVSRYASSANVRNLERGARSATDLAFARAPQAWQNLKQRSLANLYEYLYFKTFSGAVRRRSGAIALEFLCQALRYDHHLRSRVSLWLRALWKAAAIAVLPQRLAYKCLNQIGNAAMVHVEILNCIRADL